MSAPPVVRPELKVRPAPKIWDRPKPEPKPAGRLDPARRPPPQDAASAILGAILLLACSAALLLMGGPRGPDPHLRRARELIERYEELRAPDTRDYESAAYRGALVELDQVDSESRSGSEASALAQEIRSRIEGQRAASRARAAEVAARQSDRQVRDEEFFEAQKRSRLVHSDSHEECEAEASHQPQHHHVQGAAEDPPGKTE